MELLCWSSDCRNSTSVSRTGYLHSSKAEFTYRSSWIEWLSTAVKKEPHDISLIKLHSRRDVVS